MRFTFRVRAHTIEIGGIVGARRLENFRLRPPRSVSTGPEVGVLPGWQMNVNVNVNV